MRAHLLRELKLPGRELVLLKEPTFDLYHAKRVTRLCIEYGEAEAWPSVELDLGCLIGKSSYLMHLSLVGAREIRVPPIYGALFLSELEVEDVSARQLEGIRFEVVAQFDCGFRVACKDVVIVSFGRV